MRAAWGRSIASDTKLNRDVAIKVLPEAFASDAERFARFTREAQTLASLNHHNRGSCARKAFIMRRHHLLATGIVVIFALLAATRRASTQLPPPNDGAAVFVFVEVADDERG